jgi:hypothetical protein
MGLAILVSILALINALAFWQRHIFFYMLAAIGDMVFGLYYALQSDPFKGQAEAYSATWVIGALVFLIGVFCLFRIAMKLFHR